MCDPGGKIGLDKQISYISKYRRAASAFKNIRPSYQACVQVFVLDEKLGKCQTISHFYCQICWETKNKIESIRTLKCIDSMGLRLSM